MNPDDIAVDSAGNAYVADRSNHRVTQFDSGGGFVRGWGLEVDDIANVFQVCTTASIEVSYVGSLGSGDGQLNLVEDVAADPAGNLFVADANNRRVQKFTAGGGDRPLRRDPRQSRTRQGRSARLPPQEDDHRARRKTLPRAAAEVAI